MSADFLTVDNERLKGRTPVTQIAADMGAHMGVSGGFDVALAFEGVGPEQITAEKSVVICDTSQTRKVELQAPAAALAAARVELGFGGTLTNHLGRGGWWCDWHPERALLVADPGQPESWEGHFDSRVNVLEVTSVWCSMTLVGPSARELISRCCSLDLRPTRSKAGDFHPASIARTPGAILNEGADRFRLLVGWAVGQYVWEVLLDAARPLGGKPAGLECLVSLSGESRPEVNRA